MTKFCANLSFMFTEKPFLERFKLAKDAGFSCIESGFPYGLSKEEVVKAKEAAGITQVLINVYTGIPLKNKKNNIYVIFSGDVTKGELGFAAIPGKEIEFKESLEKTIPYAKSLNAKKYLCK